MGERRLRAAQRAGLRHDPGDRPGDRRRRDAARRAAGEHPPGAAQPAGGGGRLPAAAGGVRRHARGAGRPDRPQPPAGHQHHPAAEPAGGGAAPGRRRRAVGRPRPGAARPGRRRGAGRRWPTRIVAEGLSVRATEEVVALAGAEKPPATRPAAPEADRRPGGARARPSGCRTCSTPGSGSRSAGARAGSSWSSGRSTTWSGSSGLMGRRARLGIHLSKTTGAGVPRGTAGRPVSRENDRGVFPPPGCPSLGSACSTWNIGRLSSRATARSTSRGEQGAEVRAFRRPPRSGATRCRSDPGRR